jgi:carbon storage regulator
MLVLSRKPGEQVVLGNNVQLTVVAVRGCRVVLGLTAPGDVAIRREELAPLAEGPPGACPKPGDRRRPRN